MIIKYFDSYKNFKIIKNIDKNNRMIKLYEFSNITFTGYDKYYPYILFKSEDDLILPIREMSMSLKKKSFYEENNMIFNYKLEDNIFNYINEEVFYFIYNTENYFHFIYDTLPYLYSYFFLKTTNKNMKILMNFNKNKMKHLNFVIESLQLLGIDDKDIIIHNDKNKYKKIYLSNSLTHDGKSQYPPRIEIFEIYNKMIQNALSFNLKNIKINNIYISRRTWINNNLDNIGTNYTMRRKLINEDKLVEKLKNKGFQEIFMENLSMIEKIILLNNANIVIGAIGSTIINSIFCNKKCKIITLASPEFLKINYRIKYLLPKNTIIFNETRIYKEFNIPMNVRIKITDKNLQEYNKIGEITNKEGDFYLVNLSDNYIGWEFDGKYDQILIKESQFKKLDNGLNSPWIVNINKLLELI